MENSFGSLLGSPFFTFSVGEEEVENIVVHSGIVAELSKPLANMIDGPWTEGVEKRAVLKEVDKDTFKRFCEFAYLRRYTDPVPEFWEANGDEKENFKDLDTAENDLSHVLKSKKSKKHRVSREDLLKEEFLKKTFNIDHHASCCSQLPSTPPPVDDAQNFTNVFLGHAKVYVFADTYDVPSLKTLAVHKIHEILKTFNISPTNFPALRKLMEYTFNNTPSMENAVDPLRNLLAHYLVTQIDSLYTIPSFKEVLEEGGPLISLFWDLAYKTFIKPPSMQGHEQQVCEVASLWDSY